MLRMWEAWIDWGLANSAAFSAIAQLEVSDKLTTAARDVRLAACRACEHFTELSACGCNPFCGHPGLRNMKASLRPNHWLRAAQCPSGKWPEPPADLGA